MAKIVEEVVVVKLSKILRSAEKGGSIVPENFVANLEEVAAEILGDAAVIVEVMPLDQFAGDDASED